MLEERDAAGDTTVSYAWSPAYVDAMIARDRNTSGDDSVLEERLYALQDVNFNVTAVADASGNVVERYLFDPYGQRLVLDAAFAPVSGNASTVAFNHGHQGGKYDPVLTNQMLFRHRVYDVEAMRWLQQDPLGYVDGQSLYQPLKANITSRVDPLGLVTVELDAGAYIPVLWQSIPSQPNLMFGGAWITHSFVSGDARNPSPTPLRGASRIWNWLMFDSCALNGNAMLAPPRSGIGASTRQDVWLGGATTTVTRTGTATPTATATAAGGTVTAMLSNSGQVPAKIALLPAAVDYTYSVSVRHVGPLLFWSVTGTHDAFPAHEAWLTVNGNRVVKLESYTPPFANGDWINPPLALNGGMAPNPGLLRNPALPAWIPGPNPAAMPVQLRNLE